jgi:hypothetical protein
MSMDIVKVGKMRRLGNTMLIANNNNRYQMGLGIIIVVIAAMLLLAVTVIIIMIVTATTAVAAADQQQQAQPQTQQSEQPRQPFKMEPACITDVTGIFMRGYYAAHADYFAGSQYYNETLGAPPPGQNFFYDMATGQKLPADNARADYIQGYKIGWKDAQKEVFQVDC